MTTRAELVTALVSALTPIVGAGRVHARKFPQVTSGAPPSWPAIRYTGVDTTPTADICGGGREEEADVRLQIDVASDSALGESAHLARVRAVRLALSALGPEWVWDSERDLPDDFDKKTTATSLDFVVYLSSPD